MWMPKTLISMGNSPHFSAPGGQAQTARLPTMKGSDAEIIDRRAQNQAGIKSVMLANDGVAPIAALAADVLSEEGFIGQAESGQAQKAKGRVRPPGHSIRPRRFTIASQRCNKPKQTKQLKTNENHDL